MGCCGKMMGVLTNEQAAQVPLYCILSDGLRSGAFYSQVGIYGDQKMQLGGLPMEFVTANSTEEKQKQLWDWSMKELGLE